MSDTLIPLYSNLVSTLSSIGLESHTHLRCSPEDATYLGLLRWKLIAPRTRLAVTLDPRVLSVRAHHQGFWFYPHHLVLKARNLGNSGPEEILDLLPDAPKLWKFLSDVRGIYQPFMNQFRTDVRRENLRQSPIERGMEVATVEEIPIVDSTPESQPLPTRESSDDLLDDLLKNLG